MKKNSALFFIVMLTTVFTWSQETAEKKIDNTLNAWHKAAADADFDTYFGLMTNDGVFIGTDATENWQNNEFKAYAKPHFDKGKAWSFTAIERNIYLNESQDFAWFDELLDTQMKICRGSGVLKKIGGEWKIAHYVLSIAVPNEHVGELIALKKEKDSLCFRGLAKIRYILPELYSFYYIFKINL